MKIVHVDLTLEAANTRRGMYVRTSPSDELTLQPPSIDEQRGVFVTHLGRSPDWTVRTPTYDKAGRGSAEMDRPLLQRMLLDVEAGDVDIAIDSLEIPDPAAG